MTFAEMLASSVKPLAEYEPACQKRQRQVSQAAHARKAKRVVKHEDVVAKYKTAWDGEWTTTASIEKYLGYSPSAALPTLRRWEQEGLLEARPVVGANGRHKRSMGIEWRWC